MVEILHPVGYPGCSIFCGGVGHVGWCKISSIHCRVGLGLRVGVTRFGVQGLGLGGLRTVISDFPSHA